MSEKNLIVSKPDLPAIDNTVKSVQNILSSLNLPRDIIASEEEISFAWRELPREISRIPNELRDGLIARMCVATSVGLFDGAINYIWNAVILNLRLRVRNFGFGLVAQTLNKKFEEDDLYDLMDSELLDLCHKLELLSEEGYFFLNQCRDIRNNFSSAHPSIAQIDDRELINFISRCCKHGISADYVLQGINIGDFIGAIKSNKFNDDAIDFWKERVINTFPAQRTLLIPMLHGLYCDPESKEETRINALQICNAVKIIFDSKINSALIDQHNKYRINGADNKLKASQIFFQKLELLNLLTETEKHSIIKEACSQLMRAHNGFDNFYNEPPFAQRLSEIIDSTRVPETAKEEFVQSVLTCYVGNPYGVSHAALKYYEKMILNFSPKEIEYMLDFPTTQTIVAMRIKNYKRCKEQFLQALNLLDEKSLSPLQLAKLSNLKKQ